MSFQKILNYVRDPRPHTRPMYIVMGLAAAGCAWRARRELSKKEVTEECSIRPISTAPFSDSQAPN